LFFFTQHSATEQMTDIIIITIIIIIVFIRKTMTSLSSSFSNANFIYMRK